MVTLLTSLQLLFATATQAANGDWTIYSAYNHVSKTVGLGTNIYALADNRLFSYNTDDTAIETYDKAGLLNDNNIFDIVRCDKTNLIAIIYQNGNVDLLNADEDVYNMPELKSKTMQDKTLNDVYVNGENIYISTNSGIVVLDTRRRVFANYYDFNQSVNSLIIDDNNIIAATPSGIYCGPLDTNLLDAKNWTLKSTYNFKKIYAFNGKYYTLNTNNQLRLVTNKQNFNFNTSISDAITGCSSTDDYTIFYAEEKMVIIDKEGNSTTTDNPLGVRQAYVSNGKRYWLACDAKGLIGASFDGKSFTTTTSPVLLNSPLYNYFYHMRMIGHRLLSVGGCFEFSGLTRKAFATQFENGRWTNFDEQSVFDNIGGAYYFRNFNDIVQDPDDPTHHFVCGMSGIVEYKDYKFLKHYDHTNSPLKSIIPTSSHSSYYVWTSGLEYDNQHNLWMLCSQVDTTVRILKPNGEWLAYYCKEIANHSVMGKMMFDSRGWAWIGSRVSGPNNNAGLYVLNTNGTLNQRSDDKARFIYKFLNQDGTSYSINSYHCAVEDLNGAVWIGTNFGPFVTYEPSTIFSSDFRFTQCKVPRNDGTNYADYLLNEIEVRCIAVDGGNRKWMGTLGNGAYLVNEDGSEILEHFTTDNSPLITNDIYSIVIDGATGEVFFATSGGLVSYKGDAIDPVTSFDRSLVKVYPNPIDPHYEGNIIITGLMRQTNVKIADAAGRLVNEGTSVGGEYTWNGITRDGRKASSGVYYVLAADAEGKKGVAAKFLIVR